MKESEIEESFLRSFELCENKGQVTYAVRCHSILFFLDRRMKRGCVQRGGHDQLPLILYKPNF